MYEMMVQKVTELFAVMHSFKALLSGVLMSTSMQV
jgi:hypothetical protein